MKEIIFIIYVNDQKLSRNFYSKVFDSEPILDVQGMTEFKINDFTKMGIMPEVGISKILKDKTPNPSTGNGIPRCEIYLILENPDLYIKRCVDAGGKLVSELSPRNWGDKVGYVSDLDGHILAFADKI